MLYQGSEKYKGLYSIFNTLYGKKDADLNAITITLFQTYCVSLPFHFLYEKIMDMLADAFRYPLYSPELIKFEIQAVNLKFYTIN